MQTRPRPQAKTASAISRRAQSRRIGSVSTKPPGGEHGGKQRAASPGQQQHGAEKNSADPGQQWTRHLLRLEPVAEAPERIADRRNHENQVTGQHVA